MYHVNMAKLFEIQIESPDHIEAIRKFHLHVNVYKDGKVREALPLWRVCVCVCVCFGHLKIWRRRWDRLPECLMITSTVVWCRFAWRLQTWKSAR